MHLPRDVFATVMFLAVNLVRIGSTYWILPRFSQPVPRLCRHRVEDGAGWLNPDPAGPPVTALKLAHHSDHAEHVKFVGKTSKFCIESIHSFAYRRRLYPCNPKPPPRASPLPESAIAVCVCRELPNTTGTPFTTMHVHRPLIFKCNMYSLPHPLLVAVPRRNYPITWSFCTVAT